MNVFLSKHLRRVADNGLGLAEGGEIEAQNLI